LRNQTGSGGFYGAYKEAYDRYSLAPVGTPEERAALRASVIANAGAGKLP
jgi:hypothetical protein